MSLRSVFGMPIFESPLLPTYPSPAEEARRIVRRGLSDLTFRGRPLVDPGPEPRAATHGVIFPEQSAFYDRSLHASTELIETLKRCYVERYSFIHPVTTELRRARDESLRGDRGASIYVGTTTRDLLEWARQQVALTSMKRHLPPQWQDVGISAQNLANEVITKSRLSLWAADHYAFAITLPREGIGFGVTP